MWWPFNKKKESGADDYGSIWKYDFSDCVTADYLPKYSVCRCHNNRHCRFVAMYAGMTLCCNPSHKTFIPEGSEPFDPYKGHFR